MQRWSVDIRLAATKLRRQGQTYSEIQNSLGIEISKATLYHWFRYISVSEEGIIRLERRHLESLQLARQKAIFNKSKRKKLWIEEKYYRNSSLISALSGIQTSRLVLATLYLAEGTKSLRGSVVFGNSDPGVICLFLSLFRENYSLDERKFRCTLQLRADQNILGLENFWSGITNIPLSQFYKARIDPRSVGKISKKPEYKGVCRIDYLSHDLLYERMVIGNLLKGARSSAG